MEILRDKIKELEELAIEWWEGLHDIHSGSSTYCKYRLAYDEYRKYYTGLSKAEIVSLYESKVIKDI